MDTQYDYHNLPPTLHDEGNYSIIHNVHMYMEQTYYILQYLSSYTSQQGYIIHTYICTYGQTYKFTNL